MASLDDSGVRLLLQEQVDHAVISTCGGDGGVVLLAPTRARYRERR